MLSLIQLLNRLLYIKSNWIVSICITVVMYTNEIKWLINFNYELY